MATITTPQLTGTTTFSPSAGEVDTIQGVMELKSYLVQYRDHEGKEQVRIAMRSPGSDTTFMLNAKISGQNVATVTRNWFHTALSDKLRAEGIEGEVGELVESV